MSPLKGASIEPYLSKERDDTKKVHEVLPWEENMFSHNLEQTFPPEFTGRVHNFAKERQNLSPNVVLHRDNKKKACNNFPTS